jgi:hypothetical protein
VFWRRWFIYVHRWLGIAGCLVFLVWFVSGVVMMYQRMPRLTAEERLARLPALDLSGVRVSLDRAAAGVSVAPDRVRVGMLLGRPAYRLESGSEWTTVFADTGERLDGVSAEQAVRIATAFVPEHAATIHSIARLDRPDQWLLDGGLSALLPMRTVSLGDAAGTVLYISERTGEPMMKTTAKGRAWGYAGAVLHWTYFTPIRERRELWRYGIIYAALIGCVMCLSGLVVGIWRFSPSKRFRLKRVPSHSPYAGLMWWHHYAGLLFGLVSFTWALSGALSLTPWDWTPGTGPSAAEQRVVTGGPLRLAEIDRDHLVRASTELGRAFAVKEIEIQQFRGRPFAMAYRSASLAQAAAATNRDVSALLSSQLAIDRRLVYLDGSGPVFRRFPTVEMEDLGRALMPGRQPHGAEWLPFYDGYYYDRTGAKPLPVLRLQYDDPDATWLYLDPSSGALSMRFTHVSRLNRWLYNGLHSLDFPFLYYSRPAWDLVVGGVSLGGIGLTATTMVPAWRRLRRHLARPGRPRTT